MNNHKLIRSIWPLPGGNTRYLSTLVQIVQWAASTPTATRDGFGTWLMSQFNVGKSTVNSYLQVVTAMGMLDQGADGKLGVTARGRRLLEAEPTGQAQLVVACLMTEYVAFPEILTVYAQAEEPIHMETMVAALQPHFPRWTSAAQYEYRALWLLSLGCLRQDHGRYYEITEFGRTVAGQYGVTLPTVVEEALVVGEVNPADGLDEIVVSSSGDKVVEGLNLVEGLSRELDEAAVDSQNPDRFEQAIAQAFSFLGFTVDELGEAGDTDALVRANMGPGSYAAVVDAKARRDGKLNDLEVFTIRDHMVKNGADYAVVVAGRFATGKVAAHAEANDVLLLPVAVLQEWMALHARTPLNQATYQILFQQRGILERVPAAMQTAAQQRAKWGHLLVDLMELIQEIYVHSPTQRLAADHLFTMLMTRLRGVIYGNREVDEAVALLMHPALQALIDDGQGGIALAMNRETLACALRELADQVEQAVAKTEA